MTVEEDGFKEWDGVKFFTFCGMNEGKVDGHGVSAEQGTITKDNFAKDDWVAKGLFGVIVGGRHVVDTQESKKAMIITFWIDEALTKVFCL